MRVTNKMLSNSFLTDMRTNLSNLQTLQQQMTSGKEIRKPSDDPAKVARALQLHTDINANQQYKENINDTLNWLDTTDTALGQAGNVLQRVRELLVQAGNAGYGEDEKKAINNEINQRVDEFAQVLNTSYDGKYIFGGTLGTKKPLTSTPDSAGVFSLSHNVNPADISKIEILKKFETLSGVSINTLSTDEKTQLDSYINSKINSVLLNDGITIVPGADIKVKMPTDADSDTDTKWTAFGDFIKTQVKSELSKKLNVEISPGVTMEYNVSAREIVEFTNEKNESKDMVTMLNKIMKDLSGSGNAADINGTDLQNITDAINNILKKRSEVGAKQNRMESAKDKNTEETYNLTDVLSRTEDIDITEKTMQYATLQTVYMASLQTSAKVLQPTLLDYLR